MREEPLWTSAILQNRNVQERLQNGVLFQKRDIEPSTHLSQVRMQQDPSYLEHLGWKLPRKCELLILRSTALRKTIVMNLSCKKIVREFRWKRSERALKSYLQWFASDKRKRRSGTGLRKNWTIFEKGEYLWYLELLVGVIRNQWMYIDVVISSTISFIIASTKRNPYDFWKVREYFTIFFSWARKVNSFFVGFDV